jgi:hypothetical protein
MVWELVDLTECRNKYPSQVQDSVVDGVCTSTEIYGIHHLDFGNGLEPIRMCEECYKEWEVE